MQLNLGLIDIANAPRADHSSEVSTGPGALQTHAWDPPVFGVEWEGVRVGTSCF